jgi:hypothetical protein
MKNRNVTGLKIKYLGATNTLSSRMRITQLNTTDSIVINQNQEYDYMEYIEYLMTLIPEIESYSFLIDNTSEYTTIVVNLNDNRFGIPNLLINFKNL